MRIPNTAILVAALACAAPAPAQPLQAPEASEPAGDAQSTSFEELAGELQQAYRDADPERAAAVLQRMRAHRPYSAELVYRLAVAHAQSGETSQAYETLLLLQRQGLALDLLDDPALEPIADTQAFQFIAGQLADNGKPFNHAPVAFRASEALPWPAAIAHDSASDRFFVAGLRSGRILSVAPDGSARDLIDGPDDGPGGISALAFDHERGVLWAAGTEIRLEEGGLDINARAARLYRIDAETGELKGGYAVGEDRGLPHLFNELAVAPDGSVYLSDALSPIVFVLEPDAEEMMPFVGSGNLSSLQGLTLDGSGRFLFVADWHTGIYRIERDTREVIRVAAPQTVNLGGIHGLAFHDGDLVAVQTGIRPHRVVRFMLSEDMTRITDQQPLSANQPEYRVPGLGVIADGAFYFIANSGWGLFQRPAVTEAQPPVVLRADPELGMAQRRDAKGGPPVRIREGEAGHSPPALLKAPALERDADNGEETPAENERDDGEG